MTELMKNAANAAAEVAKWSSAKQDYARRATALGIPVR
jgi:hypothetical protein